MSLYYHSIGKIDFGTLAILFCLMGVVAGWNELGYIDSLAQTLTEKAKNIRMLMTILVFTCFFSSMLVTNDVSLIIFVPFTIQIFETIGRKDKLIKAIVLETIAANLGSMATPIGNPQNVYLYQIYRMKPIIFMNTILPYAGVAAVLLFLLILIDKDKEKVETLATIRRKQNSISAVKEKTVVYLLLFGLCIATVMGMIAWWVTLGVHIVAFLICNVRLFQQINYGLLIKFVILFILVGNMSDIAWISVQLKKIIDGNEFFLGIALSQVLSNVPTAIMLSKFTQNGKELLLGVNVGGLGTLIASMASMISFDFYAKIQGADKKRYCCIFTLYNVGLLVCLIFFYFI